MRVGEGNIAVGPDTSSLTVRLFNRCLPELLTQADHLQEVARDALNRSFIWLIALSVIRFLWNRIFEGLSFFSADAERVPTFVSHNLCCTELALSDRCCLIWRLLRLQVCIDRNLIRRGGPPMPKCTEIMALQVFKRLAEQ